MSDNSGRTAAYDEAAREAHTADLLRRRKRYPHEPRNATEKPPVNCPDFIGTRRLFSEVDDESHFWLNTLLHLISEYLPTGLILLLGECPLIEHRYHYIGKGPVPYLRIEE